MSVGAWVALALLAVPAVAEPPSRGAGDTTVTVLRGDRIRAEDGPRGLEQGVIVMRPAPGSFMRETARLAAISDASDSPVASLSIRIAVDASEPEWHAHGLFLPRAIVRDAGKPAPRKVHPVSMNAPR
jgi:hypothetical protein